MLLPGVAAAVVVLLVERWSRIEPWSDRRLVVALCIAALAGTFALVFAALVAAGALVLRGRGSTASQGASAASRFRQR